MIWQTAHKSWSFKACPIVMGILNVTPDSFSDGGHFTQVEVAVEHALQMVSEGAEIIDIGGESTRPNADPVGLEDELQRVIPVIEALAARSDVSISIDTRKVEVARQAVDAGASIINDVEANRQDKAMWELVARSGVGYVAMHMQGQPGTMQQNPVYEDVLVEIRAFFEHSLKRIECCGVKKEQVMLDVGIGFGKTLVHNLALLRSLDTFGCLNRPLLLGVSRKSMFGKLLDVKSPKDRMPAGLACACWAFEKGVAVIRTHDVSETVQALRMWDALRRVSTI
jgi:dihydropteroate synthase